MTLISIQRVTVLYKYPLEKSGYGWFEMRDVKQRGRDRSVDEAVPALRDFGEVANDLCEKAMQEAKEQLHPLLRDAQLDRLNERSEFVQTFKSALEQRIARKLAVWQPGVQAVFKFDETPMETWETWDGSIHLLVKVPTLSDALKNLGRKLDRSLVKYFRQLDWGRFQERQSILEVQQVTPNELRHGVGYGAMFCAVYTVPIKVWPQDKNRSG
jgi:hypothetical protein